MTNIKIFRSRKNDADKSFSNMSTEFKKAILSGTGLILMFILFALLKPELFLAKTNLINITQQIVTYSILGYGLTFCLVCGGLIYRQVHQWHWLELLLLNACSRCTVMVVNYYRFACGLCIRCSQWHFY